MSTATVTPPQIQILDMVFATIKTHALGVFAELRIADLLAEGARSTDDLALASGAHAPSLGRLLRLIAALGVLSEPGPGVYRLTEAGQLLRSDVPGSLRGIVAMFGGELHSRAWARLNHSVTTGEPAFDHVFGMPLFKYLETDPESASMFDDAMTSSSAAQAQAVVEAYDFSGIETLVDVAGGHGTLLATILKQYPGMRGVLFELPHVAAGAGTIFEQAGARDRVDVVSGDFLDHVTPGADAYIMKRIIHDWDDPRASKILTNCRRAMAPGGRVLVVDAVVDDSPASLYAKMLDIEMLTLTPHGKERTEEEFRQLFASAGLRLERIVDTVSPLKVIEARTV
jgi:hypothetical protein